MGFADVQAESESVRLEVDLSQRFTGMTIPVREQSIAVKQP
jgi:hypothetical protein